MSLDRFIILSDIHANLTALNAVIDDFTAKYHPQAIVLLGDFVNYGMRPNQTIERLQELSRNFKIAAAIRGNHDDACLNPNNHVDKFATDRGRQGIVATIAKLNENSRHFLEELQPQGVQAFSDNGLKFLCVHGDIKNPLWGKSIESENIAYKDFDYVLSGHSHKPHFLELFYCDHNPTLRDKKKTIFINPGSVGQPRNHNPAAQYVYLDTTTATIHFNSVTYNIEAEMALYDQSYDPFYKNRLIHGI